MPESLFQTDCHNCLRTDELLVEVRRVYVVPEAWDTAGSVTVMDDIELWCFSCRTQYPNEPVTRPASA